MLFSLADNRAKRMLLENNGLPSDANVVVNDECRPKPSLLFGEGRAQVCVDLRIKGAKDQRAYVPSEVSKSFAGVTCLSTATLNGKKRTLMLIHDLKYAGSKKYFVVPSKEWLVKRHKSTAEQADELPDPLLVWATSKTTFNSGRLHSSVYAPKVLGTLPELAEWRAQVLARDFFLNQLTMPLTRVLTGAKAQARPAPVAEIVGGPTCPTAGGRCAGAENSARPRAHERVRRRRSLQWLCMWMSRRSRAGTST